MARPHLRLSFKVMKEAVPLWSYRPTTNSSTPRGNIGMKEAVAMLFSAEVARQCREIVTSTDGLLDGQLSLSQSLSSQPKEKVDHFIFEACLPQPDADLSKLRLGGFISVDGRPLSFHHNGIVDRLLAIFLTSLGGLLGQMGSPQRTKARGTFMRLNIKCPAGSYDVNVDSSKTDVLFVDEKFLCDAFARLCAKTYVATDQMKYQFSYGFDKYPPSTPVRQSRLSFGGTQGRAGVTSSRVGPLQQLPSHSTNVMLTQGPNQPLFASNLRRSVARREARYVEAESPLSQLNSTSPDSQVEISMARQTIRPVGGPIEYNFTTSRGAGVQRRTDSAHSDSRHTQLSPIRKRAPIRSVPVGGLKTPPSSSPVGNHQRPYSRHHRQHGFESPRLPGLVSNDNFRQTTISFGDPYRINNDIAEADQETTGQRPNSRPSFVSARDHFFGGHSEAGPSRIARAVSDMSPAGKGTLDAPIASCTPPSPETPFVRPVHTVMVDWNSLRRTTAIFARNMKAWDEEPEYLSPEMADISSIENRLRAAVVDWLAKSRAKRKEAGAGSVQVEFYLRKSLKQKKLLLRGQGQQ
ncbi:uncharacterized protein SPSK_07344 [Sporothrix schenckii 1099-18]|uniref:DNA mismatch repair protein S5 domain-containing protein n=1 Tax=Sporothrix schenckii 1099-18 TaxID=1397361 RepID=A0A0F2MFJ7_SPOSC|nr:uncharacterized protein SPSK_07344 [Sporothrix schenckii 1099-18]KJR88453.1 hypothetical protein SPSK_07344 [Sporothrix schenckii 1099-18]